MNPVFSGALSTPTSSSHVTPCLSPSRKTRLWRRIPSPIRCSPSLDNERAVSYGYGTYAVRGVSTALSQKTPKRCGCGTVQISMPPFADEWSRGVRGKRRWVGTVPHSQSVAFATNCLSKRKRKRPVCLFRDLFSNASE